MNIILSKQRRNWKGERCSLIPSFEIQIDCYEKKSTHRKLSFKYSFPIDSEDAVKRYEECEEKFENWLKESELEDSIKNSIKTSFYDKNTLIATIEKPKHSLQD